MTLTERKQGLINQLSQMKAQKSEAEKAVSEFDTGIKRLEGALLLIAEMERDTEKAPEIASE